ncbi:MAG: hypothetical protein KAI22_01770, partial [Gammaproteobacteria bacterium]|nr:hypothetical protein [Gammaproteobacteria bacterium]
MRKSILACTVSFLMSPVSVWALGMGDIQVNSSLNQPLNAEIALHSVTKKDLDSLKVGLAPRSIYSRANIERSDYLAKFKFKLIQRNGKNYVVITTKKPFREPFANFLIEAAWGSGRLLREYTMLLDPPEFVKQQARPVTTATASRASQVKRTQTRKSTGKTDRKAASSAGSNYVLSPKGGSGELNYGPTKRNDTLWNIAKNIAPDNVSVDQMMMALLRDNPQAFFDNNINNLKAGYVLRIKERASLNKLSRSNASRQVREQYQSWKEIRKQKASTNLVDRSDRSSATAPADAQLTLIAAGKTENADMQGDLNSKAKQLKEKLSLAGEELESKEVENQELRARIKELEELLQTKTSLVELKDESLAALQKQKEMQAMEAQPEAASEPEAESELKAVTDTPVEDVKLEESVVEEVVEEVVADKKVEQAVIEEITDLQLAKHIDPSVELNNDEKMLSESTPSVSVDEVITIPEVLQSDVTASKPVEVQPEAAAEQVVKPVVKAEKKVKPKPEPAKPAAQQENVIDVLLSEAMLPYTAGGGGLVVLILAWLGLRGRGKKENEFEESILDSKMDADDSDFAVDDSELVESTESSTKVLASDTETSFLSDFSADDMESLQPDDTEADPISEADVFMVYGRYQQAEELLQSALKTEPERLDYQLKLLEVYHGDNLKDSFAVQADVVKELLKKTSDDFELTSEWTKAKSWAEKLGVDIDMPDSFDADVAVEEVSADVSDEIDSLDDSLSESNELSLDDISDDLSLESEEISFNEDSILGDAGGSDDEFDLSLDDSALVNTESAQDTDDEFELSLEDLDTAEGDSGNEFDLDESTLKIDDSLELEGDSLELEDD